VQSIEATSAIGSGQVIGEFTGNVMLREEIEHSKLFDVYVCVCEVKFDRLTNHILCRLSLMIWLASADKLCL